jgi:putative peptidoglycan lipid II flippase
MGANNMLKKISMFRSSFIFSFFTLLSRVLGFIRDLCIAIFLGAGPVADAFFAAFRVANLLRRFFAEGNFNAAFIPIYHDLYYNHTSRHAQCFTGKIFTILGMILCLIAVVAEFFMPEIIALITPGFQQDGSLFALTVDYARIMFPYLIFIVLAALCGSILNAHHYFAATASTPMILNLCMIIAMLVMVYGFDGDLYDVGLALSIAVIIAGILQFIFLCSQLWLQQQKEHLQGGQQETIQKEIREEHREEIGEENTEYAEKTEEMNKAVTGITDITDIKGALWLFIKKLVPTLLSTGVYQINLVIGTVFASFYTGAMSYLYYADRLIQLPLALIGISIANVFLSSLSHKIKTFKDEKDIHEHIHQALKLSIVLALPATIGLCVLHVDIIDCVYGYGAFIKGAASDGSGSNHALSATSLLLLIYSCALPAYILQKTCGSIFFAHQNTKTPLYTSLFAVGINIIVMVALLPFYGFYGIAMAHVISSWMQTLVMIYLCFYYGYYRFGRLDIGMLLRVGLVNIGLFLGLIMITEWLRIDGGKSTSIMMKWGVLLSVITASMIMYVVGLFASKTYDIHHIKRMIIRK